MRGLWFGRGVSGLARRGMVVGHLSLDLSEY